MNRTIAVSLILFVLAGLCEIGGGYLMWQWLREHRPVALGLVGAAVLVLYGVIPTFQSAHFGRVYAAYGGIFVILSTLWGGGSIITLPTSGIGWVRLSLWQVSRVSCGCQGEDRFNEKIERALLGNYGECLYA